MWHNNLVVHGLRQENLLFSFYGFIKIARHQSDHRFLNALLLSSKAVFLIDFHYLQLGESHQRSIFVFLTTFLPFLVCERCL